MRIQHFLSTILIIETAAIFIIGYYSWTKRKVPGALPLVALCIASSFYSLGYAMELSSTTLAQVNFWSKVQYLGLPFIPVLCVALAKAYTSTFKRKDAHTLALIALPGLATCLLRLTSEYHQLMYLDMNLVSNGYFKVLVFSKGPWYYLHFAYFFICAGYAIQMYRKSMKKSSGHIKQQLLLMVLASAMPFVSIVMNVRGAFPLGMDSGPYFIFLDYILFSIGIFRYNMLYLVPLSRDMVFDWIQDGVIVMDLKACLLDCNSAAREIFNIKDTDVAGRPADDIFEPFPDFLSIINQWQTHLVHQGSHATAQEYEFVLIAEDSLAYHYQVRLKTLIDASQIVATTMMITDISKTKAQFYKLETLAHVDALTGILNRRAFVEKTQTLKTNEGIETAQTYLAVIDLDHFKQVNDVYGHLAGDYVLRTLSNLVQKALGPLDVFGRYGGEEFVVCLLALNTEEAHHHFERLRLLIESHSFVYNQVTIPITISIGYTPYHLTAQSFEMAIDLADKALYEAKRLGRNKVCYLD